MKNEQGNQRGIALLIVMIASVLMAVLGMSMIFSSMTDVTLSNEMENKKKAFLVADAGYHVEKSNISGKNLSTLLATTTVVPQYIAYTEPSGGTDAFTFFSRNPLAPLEAMNVDFNDPPTPIGTRTVNGLLTPAGGVSLGSGRYWAKITDNDDGDGDLTADVDGKVYLRVMGVQRIGGGQVSTYGGTVKNSIAIVEAVLKQDTTFKMSSPLAFYGSDADPIAGDLFNINNSTIDGYNHDGMTLADLLAENDVHTTGGDSAAIEVLNNDPGASDATTIRNAIYDTMLGPPDATDVFIGDKSDYPLGVGDGIPSLRDATNLIRSSPDEDATHVFDANYIMNFLQKVKPFADVIYPDGTNYNGDLGDDGSVAGGSPQITYCEGDCSLGGSGHGAGLLIVRGRLDYGGARGYRGLILVLGDGELKSSGSRTGVLGGIYVAKIVGPDGGGNYSFGIPQFSFNGRTNLYYQGSGMALGYSLTPIKTIAWREISPELEPTF